MTHDATMTIEFPATSATDKRGVFASKDLLSGVESSRTQNKKDVVLTPTSMVTAIVRHFKPSGRILDPCAGRGAFASQMPGLHRNFVGIERDAAHYQTACDRIAHELDGALL